MTEKGIYRTPGKRADSRDSGDKKFVWSGDSERTLLLMYFDEISDTEIMEVLGIKKRGPELQPCKPVITKRTKLAAGEAMHDVYRKELPHFKWTTERTGWAVRKNEFRFIKLCRRHKREIKMVAHLTFRTEDDVKRIYKTVFGDIDVDNTLF